MLNMGIPMILSMVPQAVYNIVDSYFVSNMADTAAASGIGEAAVTALTLAFPVQMLIVAIGIWNWCRDKCTARANAGTGKPWKAGTIAGNAITLAGIIYAIFLIFAGIFGTEAFTFNADSRSTCQRNGWPSIWGGYAAIFPSVLYFSLFLKRYYRLPVNPCSPPLPRLQAR